MAQPGLAVPPRSAPLVFKSCFNEAGGQVCWEVVSQPPGGRGAGAQQQGVPGSSAFPPPHGTPARCSGIIREPRRSGKGPRTPDRLPPSWWGDPSAWARALPPHSQASVRGAHPRWLWAPDSALLLTGADRSS